MKKIVSVLFILTLLISVPLWAGSPSLGKGCLTSHTLVTTDNGLVYAWGFGQKGQLGSNPYSFNSSVPVAVDMSDVLSGKTIVQVANGWQHSIALASDGTVYGWGYNHSGQLGNGSSGIYEQSRSPVAVDMSGVLSGKTIISIAAGPFHTLAVDSNGKVYAWGANGNGQLGNNSNSTIGKNVPVAVNMSGVLSGKTIIQVAAGGAADRPEGDDYTVALASDGTVYSWGYNSNGQLGNGSEEDSSVPVAVDMSGVLSGKIITEIAAGGHFTLALASDGSVYAWGRNGLYGLLGNDSDAYKSNVPVAVDMSGVLSGKTVTAIAAGKEHAVVLASDGSVYTWGRGKNGRLGDNSPTSYPANSKVPVAVDTSGVLFGKTITAVAAGQEYTVALASDGTVYGWGANENGQLGNNSTTDSCIPVQVLNSDNSKFFLLEYHIPDLSTLSIESIEIENATVNANIRDLGNSNSTQHGFCWNTSGHPSIEDSKVEMGAMESTGAYSSVIDNLLGNTSYYVRAYATNTSGTAYGNILTFTTLGLPVISTVSLEFTPLVVNYLIASVNLSFLGNPELTEFGLCWNTIGNPSIEDTTLEIGLCPHIDQTFEKYIEIDLENIYYVRAYATSTIGTAYGNILTYPTLDLPVVSTLSVESIETESATVNANISDLGNPSPKEHGFCWNTSGNPSIDDSKVEMGVIESIGNYSSIISDLLGNTLYYVRAYVTNAAGTAYGDNLTFSTLETSVSDGIPSEYSLSQNYPNPFNPSTTITYQLSSDCDVELTIYDMNGNKVTTLINDNMSAGYYETSWNASGFASGLYFYKMTAGNYIETQKMLLMK